RRHRAPQAPQLRRPPQLPPRQARELARGTYAPAPISSWPSQTVLARDRGTTPRASQAPRLVEPFVLPSQPPFVVGLSPPENEGTSSSRSTGARGPSSQLEMMISHSAERDHQVREPAARFSRDGISHVPPRARSRAPRSLSRANARLLPLPP